MNTWKVILATMFIFGAGVLTGGLLVHQAGRNPPPKQPLASPARQQQVSAAGLRLEFLRRVQRELELTPEQRQRIDAVLAHSQERSKRIIEPVSPQLRDEIKRVKAEFREVLDPEQKRTFDNLFKQQQRRDPRGKITKSTESNRTN